MKGKIPDKPLCLRPGCGKPRRARGLCNTCYPKASMLINMGATTWKKLEQQGKSLPPRKKGNSTEDWLLSE